MMGKLSVSEDDENLNVGCEVFYRGRVMPWSGDNPLRAVFLIDPTVLGSGIPFPLNQVLLFSSVSVVINNLFYLILLLSINQFRWWLCVICAVFLGFMIWGQKIHMKHIMNPERCGKNKVIGNM